MIVTSTKYTNKIDDSKSVSSANKVQQTEEVSIFDEAKKSETKQTKFSSTDKNPEATLDRQTCKTLGLSEAQWNKMTSAEKQDANAKAIIKMVDDHNGALYNKILDRQTTYVAQYKRFAKRSNSADEVARLTSVIKSLDKENQLKAIISDIEYKNPEFKNVADKVMATDYVSYIEENQVAAAQKLADTANEENKVLAAKNSTKADVQQQEGVVKALMSANNEKVDVTIASQQGQYGIDKDGNKNEEVELKVFKQVNTSKYEKALIISAKRINQLSTKNKEKAVEITKATKNENAIKNINTVKEANIAEKEIDLNEKELLSAIENDDKDAIANCVNSMSTTELTQLIATNGDSDLINKILNSNPSQAVLTIINNAVKNNSISLNYKNSIKEISFFGSTVQTEMIKQAASENNLASIKRVYLNAAAKKEYDTIQAKLQLMA